MNETLKPCPFCDNEMHFIPTDQPKGWRVDGRHKSSCPFSILVYDDCTAFVTREAAAESWNTRAELGSGTCRDVSANPLRFECSECGGLSIEIAPRFCPCCGREVVGAC